MNAKQRNLVFLNLDNAIETWYLKSLNYSFRDIGKKQKRSRQAVFETWQKIKYKSMSEVQKMKEERDYLLTEAKEWSRFKAK